MMKPLSDHREARINDIFEILHQSEMASEYSTPVTVLLRAGCSSVRVAVSDLLLSSAPDHYKLEELAEAPEFHLLEDSSRSDLDDPGRCEEVLQMVALLLRNAPCKAAQLCHAAALPALLKALDGLGLAPILTGMH